MGHRPHVYLPRPWPDQTIALPAATIHHLFKVLRVPGSGPLSYTDGEGTFGIGELGGETIQRGVEELIEAPQVELTLAVAPPHERDRLRFLVEKAAELEVRRLVWLRTAFGQARLPSADRIGSWAIQALEQSGGAWLLELAGWKSLEELAARGDLYVADLSGAPPPSPTGPLTVAIGPEGGWGPAEIPASAGRIGLGRTVLRIETAAVAVAAWTRLNQ
ncbi:MAG: RsmE family RNA methyltransferase [Actinomycetota bacterium]